jgi:hypothetical protein
MAGDPARAAASRHPRPDRGHQRATVSGRPSAGGRQRAAEPST